LDEKWANGQPIAGKQGWQVSANSGLNHGLNRFKPSWQKQVFAVFSKHGTTTAALRFNVNCLDTCVAMFVVHHDI